jgi:hypothetical protein
MILYAKPLLILGIAASISAGSWMARGWFEDSKQLIAVTAQQALADEIRAGQADIAGLVAGHLSKLKGSERVIDRGVIREIQTTVFKNVCIPPDSDSYRMLNNLAKGNFASELDGQGTRDSAPTD